MIRLFKQLLLKKEYDNDRGKDQRYNREDERDDGHEHSPDSIPIAIARQLLDGDDRKQQGKQAVDDIRLQAEAQQLRDDAIDNEHVGDVNHRHEAF